MTDPENPPNFDTGMSEEELYNRQRDLAIDQNNQQQIERERKRSEGFRRLNELTKQKRGKKGEERRKLEEEIEAINKELNDL